jgi:bifunctional NMN adenylyltransferase/nudix hydrolase
MPHKFAVFIGRFQPFHNGHKHVIDYGLSKAEKVIILVGSSNRTRSIRDPWTFEERFKMITNSFSDFQNKRIIVHPIDDFVYNDEAWILNIQNIVSKITNSSNDICLLGHKKDNTSYYINLFPQWKSLSVDNYQSINSTDIRKDYFSEFRQFENSLVPLAVNVFLENFKHSNEYADIRNEIDFINDYKNKWKNCPYPPTFITVDAVVVQSGHVLLITRKALPGKGLFALPGGFINQDESLIDGCIRELREETKLKVPEPILKGNIKNSSVFDDPNRSSRGRTITYAYHIELPFRNELPKVKGSDDAKNAFWLPLSEIDPKKMFEDHYFIISKFLGI